MPAPFAVWAGDVAQPADWPGQAHGIPLRSVLSH